MSRSLPISPANPQRPGPDLPAGILAQIRLLLLGALAGASGGGLTAVAMATIAASIEPWTHAPGPWLATTSLAALLAMAMGAWSGARSGILTSIILAILKNHRLAVLAIAPLIGFTSGLVHGILACQDVLPSVHLERPVGMMESIPFYVAVQLGAVFFTLWWLHPAEKKTDP